MDVVCVVMTCIHRGLTIDCNSLQAIAGMRGSDGLKVWGGDY